MYISTSNHFVGYRFLVLLSLSNDYRTKLVLRTLDIQTRRKMIRPLRLVILLKKKSQSKKDSTDELE